MGLVPRMEEHWLEPPLLSLVDSYLLLKCLLGLCFLGEKSVSGICSPLQ